MDTDIRNDRKEDIERSENQESKPVKVTLRSLVLGVICIMILSRIMVTATVWEQFRAPDTLTAPSAAAIMMIIIIMFINWLSIKIQKKELLLRTDLAVIYIMVAFGGLMAFPNAIRETLLAIGAHRVFLEIGGADYTPAGFINPAVIPGAGSIDGWILGETSVPWGEWILPLLLWSVFFGAFIFTMICVTTLVREHWNNIECLRYPLVEPVLEITNTSKEAPFTKIPSSRLLLLGAIFAGLFYFINGLSQYWPVFPGIQTSFLFTREVAGRLGYEPGTYLHNISGKSPGISIEPIYYGILSLVSLDMLFSLWFMYVLNYLGRFGLVVVYGDMLPGNMARYVTGYQSAGGMAILGIVYLYLARRTIRERINQVFNGIQKSNDPGDPVSMKVAVYGAIIGTVFGVLFLVWMGGRISFALILWVTFVLWSLSWGRARADAGIPLMGSGWMYFGQHLARSNVTALVQDGVIYNIVGRATQWGGLSSVGAQILDSYRIGERRSIEPKGIVLALVIAFLAVMIFSVPMALNALYERGALNTGINAASGGELTAFINYSKNPTAQQGVANIVVRNNVFGTIDYGLGIIILTFLRTRYTWFPILPISFPLSSQLGGMAGWFFGVCFVMWLVKFAMFRYGGVSLARRVQPFFMGLIVGSIVMQGLISLVGLIFPA